MRTVAKAADLTISLHILLPIAAGVLFAALCVAGIRQNHVIDIQGWSHPVGNTVRWGEEPTDIGTPADVLLLALNLPALIALLPLSRWHIGLSPRLCFVSHGDLRRSDSGI